MTGVFLAVNWGLLHGKLASSGMNRRQRSADVHNTTASSCAHFQNARNDGRLPYGQHACSDGSMVAMKSAKKRGRRDLDNLDVL